MNQPAPQLSYLCAQFLERTYRRALEMHTYEKLINDMAELPSLRQISYWGFGKPLLHPGIDEMVTLGKQLGVKTQIITNALLLDNTMAEANAKIRTGFIYYMVITGT